MNKNLAKIFYEIADMLAADKVEFKPFAWRKAAQSLGDLEQDVASIYARGGLKAVEEIPGIGNSIGKKIEEYILKGRIGYYQELKRRLPMDWEDLVSVQGIGPKKTKFLFQKLGIKSIADLEAAARGGRIAGLPGFGKKSEQNIIEGVEFRKKSRGRFLLGEILPQARMFGARLADLRIFEKIDIAGSLRRGKETIGDIDFLAVAPKTADVFEIARAMDFFASMPEVEKIWGKGDTKLSVRAEGGFNMDLRILPSESYGAALQYFTGSKEHNIALRRRAQEMGLKLSEYGLFSGDELIAGANEKELYEKLGLRFIEPELRENLGEIEAAAKDKLPVLVAAGDLKGDLHCHSNWAGGDNSIAAIAAAARAMDYEYVGIADHTKFLKIENGLDEAALVRRNREIDKLNKLAQKQAGEFVILKGCEANIMSDGSIDISDMALSELDFAIAGVHSNFKMGKSQMTRRIVRAMENPHIDIISHPTGRLLKKRPGYEIDFEAICEAACATGTILEINAHPDRLDLNDWHIRRALSCGVKMIINTDAHNINHLRFVQFGIAQARRGWAEAKDIVNAYPWQKLRSFLKRNQKRVN